MPFPMVDNFSSEKGLFEKQPGKDFDFEGCKHLPNNHCHRVLNTWLLKSLIKGVHIEVAHGMMQPGPAVSSCIHVVGIQQL